jgi:hypothetical protein
MAHGEGGSTMGGKVLTIIALVVIAGVALYLWNSGVGSKGVGSLGSLFPSFTSSSTASSSGFGAFPPGFSPPTESGGSIGGPGSGESVDSYPYGGTTIEPTPPTTTIGNPGISPYEIPAGFTAAQLSPFFHEILFGSVYAGFGGTGGEISLYSDLNQNETVDVTGWKIQANQGSEFVPQAVDLYQPSGFAAPTDIRLSSNQTLYLYSSPGTINLRLNECIGYLQNDLHTSPELPLTCPYVNQSQISNLTGQCQNYILSTPACTVPDSYNPQIPTNDYACQQFLNTMNYTGCFNAHASDANFLSNQWWTWTGSNILNPYHDNVYLYDTNGLLVDEYSY